MIKFFSNYVHSQIDEIVHNLTDIRSPAYLWLFLWILIRLYRKSNNLEKIFGRFSIQKWRTFERMVDPKPHLQFQDSAFLLNYFPNMFAEVLIVINPGR
jgi:hypothetical protein